MRHRSRAWRALAIGAVALAAGGATAPTATLEVQVHSLRSSKGLVQVCLTSQPDHFPECEDDATAIKATVPAARSITLSFTKLKPGRYAIALLHDENGNGKVDTALMIPKEGFGFSRDARVVMGPPSFDSAAFNLAVGNNSQRIGMRYLF